MPSALIDMVKCEAKFCRKIVKPKRLMQGIAQIYE